MFAVVAVLVTAAVVGKIAHAVARGISETAQIAGELVHVVVLAAASVLALAVFAGITVVAALVWGRYGRRLRLPRPSVRPHRARPLPVARPGCLSCGGLGRVLAPARSGVLVLTACRVCVLALADRAPAAAKEVSSYAPCRGR